MPDSSTIRDEALQRAGDFATRVVAGETILVPVRRGVVDLECVFTVDEVGSAVWRVLAEPRTAREVVDEIVAEFDVDEEEARRDVSEFLESMRASGLIKSAGEPARAEAAAR